MVSIDSCLADSMKPQVLTTITSAAPGSLDQLVAGLVADAEHDLGVDAVLRTSERNEVDGLLCGARLGHGA